MSVAGVLLAAGSSRRMGRPKALLPYAGSTLMRRAAEALCATACSPRLVIVGRDAEKSCRQVEGLDVEVVVNRDHLHGLSTSIRAALDRLEAIEAAGGDTTKGLLITLVDQPLVTAQHLDAILEAGSETGLVATSWATTFGPPTFLCRDFFPLLKKLQGDEGAKKILKENEASLRLVAFPGAAHDVDDDSDYARLLSGEKA